MMHQELEKHRLKTIVLDTRSSWVYIGMLEKVTQGCVMLLNADAHDSRDSATTKEVYIFETRTTGIKPNRKRVHVCLADVIGFSLLEDVIEF